MYSILYMISYSFVHIPTTLNKPILMPSTGMAALDSKASGKMGMRAVIYYMTTTFIAVFVGIIIVLVIHPGKGSKAEFGKQQKIEQVSPADAFLDLIR